VMALQSALPWNSTPNVRLSTSRSSGAAAVKLVEPYQTEPLAGSFKPIMCRKSVLFPPPLPPMMKKMSLRRIVKSRSCITTNSPNAIVRPFTVMWASRVSTMSDSEDVREHREETVGHDDPDDPEHDRGGRRLTDRGRVASGGHAAQTAGERHQHAEDHALADTEPNVDEPDGAARLHPVLGRALPDHVDGHGRPAEDPDQIGVAAEERHHERQREHA